MLSELPAPPSHAEGANQARPPRNPCIPYRDPTREPPTIPETNAMRPEFPAPVSHADARAIPTNHIAIPHASPLRSLRHSPCSLSSPLPQATLRARNKREPHTIPTIPIANLHDPLAIPHTNHTIPETFATHLLLL